MGLGFLFLVLASQTAGAQDLNNVPLSDDGRAVGAMTSSGPESRSFAGNGRVLQLGETDDALANVRAVKESAEDVWKLWNARPMVGGIGTESIIGTDERKLVNPTTVYPYRADVLITFDTGSGSSRCTGWLIGANTVATAGHCVHTGKNGASGFYKTSSYKIYPGRNGTSSPYGSCTATRLYTVSGYANGASDEYDYGAIKLGCNIGNTTGWYGFFWTSASLTGLPTTTNGYPGDKPLTQWQSVGKVTVTQDRRVFYQNDTVGGQSGSPVWYKRDASCFVCAMAVHAYGTYGSAPFSTNNHGTRITSAVFNNLVAWKNAP